MRLFLVFLTAGLFFSFDIANANTIYVSKSGDGSDGVSWETSFNTVTDAIDSATAGDEIWVASGTYFERIELKDRLSLLGGFSGVSDTRNPDLYTTTLDGSMRSGSVVTASGVVDVVLEAFEIRGGNAIRGGGLYIEHSAVTIRKSEINNSDADLTGGGIFCLESTVGLEGSRIYECTANSSGGGLSIRSSTASIRGSSLSNNTTELSSGGIEATNSVIAMQDSICTGNGVKAKDFRGGGFGGGVAIGNAKFLFVNCLLASNFISPGDIQTGWGGAVYCASATGSFEHCTFRDNQSDQADGLYISTEWADGTGTGSRIEIKNSILWNRLVIKNSTVEVSYSDTLEPIGGPGNLSLDPRFTEAAIPGSPTFDYRIKLESPCIDAATNSEVAADIEGNPRPVDVLGRGNDSGFDMGSYEFQLKKSDLTRDGKVDAEDLLMFQEEWMREEE